MPTYGVLASSWMGWHGWLEAGTAGGLCVVLLALVQCSIQGQQSGDDGWGARRKCRSISRASTCSKDTFQTWHLSLYFDPVQAFKVVSRHLVVRTFLYMICFCIF